jgi:hypothetical protein
LGRVVIAKRQVVAMKQVVRHSTILFFILWLTRCAPIHVPAAHNVPMFSGKGEFQGSVGAGLGFNAQTAYAVTDHVAVAANYLFAKREDEVRGRKHKGGELALGYYTNFNESWCFEVFAGYGISKGSAYDSAYANNLIFPIVENDKYEATGTFNKIYIQPSVGFRKNDFTWSFSVKLSYVNATEISISRYDMPWWSGEPSQVFLSWVGDGQAPIWKKKIFVHYQLGANVPLGDDPVYDYEPIMGSIGVLVKLKPTK